MISKLFPLAAVAGLAFAGLAQAQDPSGAKLTVQQSDQYGSYVADAQGRALYMFTKDTRGEGASGPQSHCQDQCAQAWPPLTVQGQPAVGEQIRPDLLGLIDRQGGQQQVTYGGWPLYYFVKDQGPGEVKGQDVHGFGGEWYLVSPDGSKNEQK